MRVLLSCLQSTRKHDIPAYEFWRGYFIEGCREAGIEVLEVPGADWAEGIALASDPQALDAWRDRTWERTLAYAREQQSLGPVDFFLGYLYPWQVEPMAITELRRMGIPCVNFFCDNLREFRHVPDAYKVFDLHWVPEYEALPMYRRAGLSHIHAPMPCWIPERLRSVPERESEPSTFIGSADVLRKSLLGQAFVAGADFMVRGPGWDVDPRELSRCVGEVTKSGSRFANQFALIKQHGLSALGAKIINAAFPLSSPTIPPEHVAPAVFGQEYFRVTREAQVTVGVNRVPVTRRPLRVPLAYSRLRDIEAPMLGACYLTEFSEGVAQLYDLGNEIECYRSVEELVGKLEQLQREPERRKMLRVAGQRKALEELSVKSTFGQIINELGLRGLANPGSPIKLCINT